MTQQVDTNIQIDDLTNADVAGRGVFDELMRAVGANLIQEYEKQRITGGDYAEVYLGSIQTVLAQATQFVLQKGTQSKQVELLNAQLAQTEAQTRLIEKQILLADAQLANTQAETALTQQRLLTEVQNTELVGHQADNALLQAEILRKQALKLDEDTELVTEQIYNAQAQRLDTVNSLPVAGAIGKQKELYSAQIDGFSRDAEQKLLKILLDTWSVSRTTNDAVTVPSQADNSSIDQVITKARQGIGLS